MLGGDGGSGGDKSGGGGGGVGPKLGLWPGGVSHSRRWLSVSATTTRSGTTPWPAQTAMPCGFHRPIGPLPIRTSAVT